MVEHRRVIQHLLIVTWRTCRRTISLKLLKLQTQSQKKKKAAKHGATIVEVRIRSDMNSAQYLRTDFV